MNRTIVVAGGGPVGLMLACELGTAGVPVTVLERAAAPNSRSPGMAIHGRTLEVLDQRGLADRVRADGESFVWPRTPFALMWLNLDTVTERDYTIAYPQWRTERLLEEHADELGVEVRRGHEVTGFTQDDAAVTVRVSGPDGEYQIEAAYLLGCDGKASTVRALAGIGFPGEGIPHYGMFADIQAAPGFTDSFQAGLYARGMASAMPISPGVLRLMAVELEVEPPPGDQPPTLEELTSMIGRITGTEPLVAESQWVSRFGGYTRLAERYRSGRVFLAGDAAHELFISGTQGLNSGIQDAFNLGWKLAADVGGWAPPGLLDSYESERRPVAERLCAHARATLVLLHQSTGKMGPLRQLIGEFLQYDEVNRYLLQLPGAAHYELAADGGDGSALVGDRIPDAGLLADGRKTSVLAELRSGRGVLFELSGTGVAPPAAAAWAGRVDVVHAQPVPELAASTILVRPDGYVVYADLAGTDPDRLRSALASWFGQPLAAGRH
jgi:2-polyprenyl-6-methoxyphenol hydroxylase-like FAD-dependent oxidoreductase